jgi:SpoIIAA-like
MVEHELLQAEGILILRPKGQLEASDFQSLAKEVDPYIEANGKLQGILLDAEKFPGWKDFAALFAHLRFVREHHRKIEKIAVVSDSSFLSFAPKIATHFVQAEIRHFPQLRRQDALAWLLNHDPPGAEGVGAPGEKGI